MRTYKEYYNLGLEHHNRWFYNQKEEWWKDKKSFEYLSPKGDYIDTVNLISIDEKNNASLFHNHTNVKNREWDILFSMLGQALIDWCRENVKWNDLWSIGISIKKEMDGCSPIYDCSYYVNKYDGMKTIQVTDEDELKKFEGCGDFLYDLVIEFLSRYGKDVPNDWNRFAFGLDSLAESCDRGEWICASDGYMNLASFVEGEDGGWTEFIECM